MEDESPQDPFGISPCYTTEIGDAAASAKWVHRVKIGGLVTYHSFGFVEVEDEAPEDPFGILACYTAEISDAAASAKWVHRVKIGGIVTYRNGRSIFVQDVAGRSKGKLVE